MRYSKLTALAALAALLLPACSRMQEEESAAEGRQAIRFTASVGGFATKATDTSFEAGDAVGLDIFREYYHERNRRMVYQDGALVPESPVFWESGQSAEQTTEFWAYYPYLDNHSYLDYDEILFAVRTNQSTHKGFTTSDLMTAHTQSAPADGDVHLHFVHRLSKVMVYVDNKLDGVNIVEAYLGNVLPEAIAEKDGTTRGAFPAGGKEYVTVKMGEVQDRDGKTAWACIVPPQYSALTVTLVGSDGKYYTYASQYELTLQSGCKHTALIGLSADSVSMEFSKLVEEWVDNGDINYNIPDDDRWSICGHLMGADWNEDFDMERAGEVYWAPIYYQEGDAFKFRQNHDWGYNFGCVGGDSGWHELFQGGKDIYMNQPGLYSVTLYPEKAAMYIAPANEMKDLSLVGTIYGSDWDKDFPMEAIAWAYSANEIYPIYRYSGLTYHKGQEFKIRFRGDWALNYGAPQKDPVEDGFEAVKGGENIILSQGDGVYDIYFDWMYKEISIEKVGELPSGGTATIEEVLNGEDGQEYEVTGIVSSISNISYGNFYLLNEDGSRLYIYGLTDAEGQYPKDTGGWFTDQWGFVYGDVITVKGTRSTYKGTIEFAAAQLVQVVSRRPLGILIYNNTFEADGGQATFAVRYDSKPEYYTQEDWAQVSGVEDIEGTDKWQYVFVDVSENTSTEERQTYFIAETAESRLGAPIYQGGASTTIADVINGADGDLFTVTGTVTMLSNTGYGNLYIKDDTGQLFVYGMKNAAGQYPKDAGGWYTDEFGFVTGDVITVTGVKNTYNETAQLVDVQVQDVVRTPIGMIGGPGGLIPYTGATFTYMVRSEGTPEASTDQSDWVRFACESKGNGWYEVSVAVSENGTEDHRIAQIKMLYGSYYVATRIEQEGKPVAIVNDGSREHPYTVAEARSAAANLKWTDNNNYDKTDPVYVKGIVSYVSYAFKVGGSATIFISDSGERKDELQLYRVHYLDNRDFAEGDTPVEVGDEVLVYGPLMNYQNKTPETVANEAYLVSIN